MGADDSVYGCHGGIGISDCSLDFLGNYYSWILMLLSMAGNGRFRRAFQPFLFIGVPYSLLFDCTGW